MKNKTKSPDGKTKISVNIPDKLLTELDLIRKKQNLHRSNWISSAIMEKLSSIRKEQN